MINIEELITKLNKSCSVFFIESEFRFYQKKPFFITTNGNVISKASNWRKGIANPVNVVKWFEDIWVYSEMNINGRSIQLSLSIFQGDDIDPRKNQLMRAEWDNYPDGNEDHPQPHWHISSNMALENTFEEYANAFAEDGLLEALVGEKDKILDINKLHLPMCATWLHDHFDFNEVDSSKIVKWYCGLFFDLRKQIKYCK